MIDKNLEFDLIIEPGRSEKNYWNDLWRYRELFGFLAWRDILVRYKQTVLGLAWSLIRPFLTMVVLTVIFGGIAKLPSDGVPYAIMVYAAMLPWQFFATSFTEASNSLISNSNMLTKIYFPRLIVPSSTVIVNLVDFLISFVILVGLMFWYNLLPTWNFFALPIFLILSVITALGAGYYVAALNVKYRDFRFIVPFIVQFGLYICPVAFSISNVSEKYRLLYFLNPMTGIIDGFRWSIIGHNYTFNIQGFMISFVMIIALFVLGLWYFRKMERQFADII